ncbi:MAG: UbiD family decarboxylase [Gammaproteobacteria bacterium]|nr:UbiD family decarboxylase [Gammaproteobacteria bacterium]
MSAAAHPGAGFSPRARAVAGRVRSLRDFLALLTEQGQCVTWPEPVLPEPDIREISVAAGRDAAGGPAVLFDRIRGYPDRRAVVGVHGSFANLALLLGRDRATSIRELFFEIIGRWGSDRPLLERVRPEDAPVNACRIERDINLYELLPLYRINEFDGGFYIAKANVVSRDPRAPEDFGRQNVGIYRIQVHGPDTFTLLSVPSHDVGRQIVAAEEDGVPFRIAVMLGNHPAMAMFAATPIGYDESEFAYASQMMGAPLELTTSGNGLDVLARTEMVIEADLVAGERMCEGPFGEFPGSYSGVRRAPLFRVSAVSHQPDPIFESIYIGKGWTEHDTLIGLNTCAPIYAALKRDFPEVACVNALYQHGLTGIIAVKNRYAGFAKSVAMRALGTPHGLMYLKNLIMVDADIDPFDLNQVMWALSTRTRASDVIVIPNMPMVIIDPAAEVPGKGHRLIIDATSFMPPDNVGADARIVSPPTGPQIDALARRLQELQARALGR